MFRHVYNRVRFNYLAATVDQQLLYYGGTYVGIPPSLGLSTVSVDQIRKREGFIEWLSLAHPHRINIHLDNNDYLHLSFDPELVVSDAQIFDTLRHYSKNPNNDSSKFMESEADSVHPTQGSDNIMSGVFLQKDCLQDQISDLLAKQILGKETLVIPAKTHIYIDTAAHESLWQGASRGIIHKIKHNSLDDLEENLRKFGSGIIVVDSLYSGKAAHESLWQGASRGIIHKIKHNSLEDLEQNLRRFGSGIIVVDSLYSAKGSIANLVQLCNLKERYDCLLVVDESHSIGLYGPHGRGLAAMANVTDRIDFITGSLAKAYCVRAGFIAGRSQEVLYVREISSQSIFSSALMTWDLQRLRRAISIIYNADSKRKRLMDIATAVRHAAVSLKFDVEQSPFPSPILCLIGGPNEFSKKLQIYFENEGISGAIFIAPATPATRSILRLTLHAALSNEDVTRIISTLELIAQSHRADLPYTFLKY
ncbi:unnamed protein product [Adineta ricciae]|uniref:Aminotransferase class I/classII large domain-containing protein n=1 Tax=Adineta ricciae TaxID=249248 RepID=A0A815T6Z5_ADIRI|nr:unnamed protein product [Adineta ricciae]